MYETTNKMKDRDPVVCRVGGDLCGRLRPGHIRHDGDGKGIDQMKSEKVEEGKSEKAGGFLLIDGVGNPIRHLSHPIFDTDDIVAALELYADPANWTPDGKFSPVMKHIDADDPYWPARQALNSAGI